MSLPLHELQYIGALQIILDNEAIACYAPTGSHALIVTDWTQMQIEWTKKSARPSHSD